MPSEEVSDDSSPPLRRFRSKSFHDIYRPQPRTRITQLNARTDSNVIFAVDNQSTPGTASQFDTSSPSTGIDRIDNRLTEAQSQQTPVSVSSSAIASSALDAKSLANDRTANSENLALSSESVTPSSAICLPLASDSTVSLPDDTTSRRILRQQSLSVSPAEFVKSVMKARKPFGQSHPLYKLAKLNPSPDCDKQLDV